ncbi:MAG TPA: metal ABC transporter ATP-binding protein [Phycisphaerales bacterium]|nr:metal ABC transporter ATP-binding protein [Phycisphaerales bacterium]
MNTHPASVEFQAVSFRYPTGGAVLSNVSLRVEPGEFLGILGPNGGGKTTLLKIMLGLLGGYTGNVLVGGVSPKVARTKGLIGYVPQRNAAELSFPVSATQVVEMGAMRHTPPWSRGGSALQSRVQECLRLVGASSYATRPIGALSGGQVQRLLIARALAPNPSILVLDEPTVGIDAAGQQQFAELLSNLHRELKLTILLVSHDVRTLAGASSRCDRIACLRRTLHFHAAPHGLTPQVIAEVFQHDLASVFGDVHVDAHPASECCTHDHERHHPNPASRTNGTSGGGS